MVTILLLALGLTSLLLSRKLIGDFFSPPAIFLFFWCVSIGLLFLDIVDYHPISPTTWYAVSLGMFSFLCGCFFPLAGLVVRPEVLGNRPLFTYFDQKRFEGSLLVLFGLGILGFLIQLYHLQTQIGFHNFLTNPQAVREVHSNVKYLGFFNILNLANFALGIIYLLVYRKPKRWVLVMLGWAIVTTFLSTDRTRFFYAIIWSFYSVAYLPHRLKLRLKTLLAAGGTLLTLGIFFILIAVVYKKQSYEHNQIHINLPPAFGFVADPYIYLTGSYPVLDAFLDEKEHEEPLWGKHALEPAVKVIEAIVPNFQRAELVSKFYNVPLELNVGTFLQPFFYDFGWIGIAIIPFVLGWFTSFIYARMRQRKTPFLVYSAGIFSFCTTISIFVNHYTQVATWFFVIVGFLHFSYAKTRLEQPDDVYRAWLFPD